MRELFVVIPANGRHQMITDLLASLGLDPRNVIIIDNGANPSLEETHGHCATVINDRPSPQNIQRWWNHGWEIAAQRAEGQYAVGFLNSDLLISRGNIDKLVSALDTQNASVAYVDQAGVGEGRFVQSSIPGPSIGLGRRMTGWCFVVRGELSTRFDESMEWWYGDDDFEWLARLEFDGCILVGGAYGQNRDSDGAQREYPALYHQCLRDKDTFINKWGVEPSGWAVYNVAAYNARLRQYRNGA